MAIVAATTCIDPTTVAVRGISPGTTTITATWNGFSESCEVIVTFGTAAAGVQDAVDVLATANKLVIIRGDVMDSSIMSPLSEYCEPYGYEWQVESFLELDTDRWEVVIYFYCFAN